MPCEKLRYVGIQYFHLSRKASTGSEVTLSATGYDTAGRVTFESDLLGTTTFSEQVVSGHRVRTATRPGVGTRIETFYPDGQLLSVTGTAAHPVTYEYGADASGMFRKEVRGAEWVTTYSDLAGRDVKTVYPGPAEAARVYSNGQLRRETDPDAVTLLYAYNALGEREYVALDMDRDGEIGFGGPDRITRTVTDFFAVVVFAEVMP